MPRNNDWPTIQADIATLDIMHKTKTLEFIKTAPPQSSANETDVFLNMSGKHINLLMFV